MQSNDQQQIAASPVHVTPQELTKSPALSGGSITTVPVVGTNMRPAAPTAAPAAGPQRLGRVVSIAGARIVALIDRGVKDEAGIQMGALVKVIHGESYVFGLVEGMSIPMPRERDGDRELRMVEISLLGEIVRVSGQAPFFHRGVSAPPSLDAGVWMATQADARLVYSLSDRQAICVGAVHQSPGVPANISVNDLLGKHFALLGTTGTGKSCGLTLILKGILAQHPNAHILLLDPHGEYGHAFGDKAELLSGETLRLPYWIFNFEEIVEVVFGVDKATSSTEIMYLRELILAAKHSYAKEHKNNVLITVDTPVPYAMGELKRLLDDAMGRLDNHASVGPYTNLKSRLVSLQADRRYNFMFAMGLSLRDNLAAIIGKIFRVPADGRPIAIIDLAGIPSEILNVVVAVVCRMAFDFALWGGQRAPLLLVCEEAHRYAPQDVALGFEPAKRGLARIAKEGRKYGISLGVLSQRPSDLASSILSQCSTVMAFRMTNEKDQEIISATLSDAAQPLVTSLPLLGNGEALVVGEGVSVPMRVRLASLPTGERPRSGSASFSTRWKDQNLPSDLLAQIVEGWRGQKNAEGGSSGQTVEDGSD